MELDVVPSPEKTAENQTGAPKKAPRAGGSSIWSTFGQLITPFAALSFLLSVDYDWGYLGALGLSFADVPTTISDHVRSALVWAPWVLTSFGAGVFWGVVNPVRALERKKARFPFIARHGTKLLIAGCVALIASKFLLGKLFPNQLIVLFPILIFFWIDRCLDARAPNSLAIETRVILTAGPALLLLVYFLGESQALELVHQEPEVRLTTSPPGLLPERVSVLKYLDRGVLVSSGDGRALFLGWDQIETVSQPIKVRPQS